MGEPSCLHGVLHTNAGCLGSDQEQKGSVLGSTISSSLTSPSASSAAVKAGAAPALTEHPSWARLGGKMLCWAGRRAPELKPGGNAPSHLLAHHTELTSELLGAAQLETVKPEDPLPPLWCTQKPTKS